MADVEAASSSGEHPEIAEKPDEFPEPDKKRRKIGKSSDGKSTKLEQRLGGILCCAVCLDLPRSAVYQASYLHLHFANFDPSSTSFLVSCPFILFLASPCPFNCEMSRKIVPEWLRISEIKPCSIVYCPSRTPLLSWGSLFTLKPLPLPRSVENLFFRRYRSVIFRIKFPASSLF